LAKNESLTFRLQPIRPPGRVDEDRLGGLVDIASSKEKTKKKITIDKFMVK